MRIDSAVEQGGEVSVFYDPMIAKLIAHAPTREAAASALAAACRQVEVWPVRTNAAFLARCLDHPDFLAGDVDTGFIPARLEALIEAGEPSEGLIEQAFDAYAWDQGAKASASAGGPWGFRVNAPASAKGRLQVRDAILERDIHAPAESIGWALPPPMGRPGDRILLFENGEAFAFTEPDYDQAHAGSQSDGAITAPMPGRIVSVDAAPGQSVVKGAKLVTLEAMKMEHGLTAPFDGVVAEVSAISGAQVSEGAILVRLDPA